MSKKEKTTKELLQEISSKLDTICGKDKTKDHCEPTIDNLDKFLKIYNFWIAPPRKHSSNFHMPETIYFVCGQGGGGNHISEVDIVGLSKYILGDWDSDMILPSDVFVRLFDPITDQCTIDRINKLFDLMKECELLQR